ncbi:MAG: hypothetical protein HYT30_00215 [Parcubacteria group bacterium]|nr:hypothetical protein [Parcubacteria group bacterium]
MTPYRTNRISFYAICLFFLVVLAYAYFEARNVIRGPEITLAVPSEGLIVHESLVLVRGSASNITELRMNGRVVPTTEAGAFEEAHLLAAGYNKITLHATDKMGRETVRNIELVYSPLDTASTSSNSTSLKK